MIRQVTVTVPISKSVEVSLLRRPNPEIRVPGRRGVGIDTIQWNADGSLSFVLTDGSTRTVGGLFAFSDSQEGQLVRYDGTNWVNWSPDFLTKDAFAATPAGGITSTQVTNWDTSYSWGNHGAAGYLTAEVDPVFQASAAGGIVGQDITNWNAAYGLAHAAVTIGATPNGLSLVGQVLSIAAAGAAQPGVVSTGAQTFSGAKTFAENVLISKNNNVSLTISGPVNGAYSGILLNSNTNNWFISQQNNLYGGGLLIGRGGFTSIPTLFVSATDRVGIGGITSPDKTLHVAGSGIDGAGARIADTFVGQWDATAGAPYASFSHYTVRATPAILHKADGELQLRGLGGDGIRFTGGGTVGGRLNTSGMWFFGANVSATSMVQIRGATATTGNAMAVENWNGAAAANLYTVQNNGQQRWNAQISNEVSTSTYIFRSHTGGLGNIVEFMSSNDNIARFTSNSGSGDVWHVFRNTIDAADTWVIGRANSGVFRLQHWTGNDRATGTGTDVMSISISRQVLFLPAAPGVDASFTIRTGRTVAPTTAYGSLRLEDGAAAISAGLVWGSGTASNDSYLYLSNLDGGVIVQHYKAYEDTLNLGYSGSKIGFFAASPVARPVVPTGSTTDQVISALQLLGLVSQT